MSDTDMVMVKESEAAGELEALQAELAREHAPIPETIDTHERAQAMTVAIFLGALLGAMALGQVLETMGFRPVARHRSREVLLYRQGTMNVVINAHAGAAPEQPAADRDAGDRGHRRCACATPPPPTGARSTAAPGRCRCRWR